jgi:hypothetical protein
MPFRSYCTDEQVMGWSAAGLATNRPKCGQPTPYRKGQDRSIALGYPLRAPRVLFLVH